MTTEVPFGTPVSLPPTYRILANWEMHSAAVYAALGALDRFSPPTELTHGEAEEMVTAALATVGVFTPPPHPHSLEAGRCTALCLSYADAQAYMFGEWQQCLSLTGHVEAEHEHNGVTWTDGQAGTVPAVEI